MSYDNEMPEVKKVHDAFREELDALLKKYNAELYPAIEGEGYDSHGVGVEVHFVHSDIINSRGLQVLSDFLIPCD